jgi:hypothetical protein
MNKFALAAGAALALAGATALNAAVTAASYYTMQSSDLRASKIIGTTVYNAKNENIGEVNEILLNSSNSIQAFVLGVGGFLGVGERNVAVTPTSLSITKDADGNLKLIVNADKDGLQKAPEIKYTSSGSM